MTLVTYKDAHLSADSDANGDDEEGHRELVEDPEGAVHVPEDLLAEDGLDQHRQNAENVDDVEHRDARDDGVHERLDVLRFSEKQMTIESLEVWRSPVATPS